jgi:hypothetical protein
MYNNLDLISEIKTKKLVTQFIFLLLLFLEEGFCTKECTELAIFSIVAY